MRVDEASARKSQAAEVEQNTPTARYRYTKADRLLKRADFERLRNGKKVQTRHFIALFEANAQDRCRFGVTASRKVGNAVIRNRLKRLSREYFRQNRHLLITHRDIHVIAKREAGAGCNSNVLLSLEKLFHKIGAFQDD